MLYHCLNRPLPRVFHAWFQENVSLIKEINDLRRELKLARTQIHDLEAAIKQNLKREKGGDYPDIYAVMLKVRHCY